MIQAFPCSCLTDSLYSTLPTSQQRHSLLHHEGNES